MFLQNFLFSVIGNAMFYQLLFSDMTGWF